MGRIIRKQTIVGVTMATIYVAEDINIYLDERK